MHETSFAKVGALAATFSERIMPSRRPDHCELASTVIETRETQTVRKCPKPLGRVTHHHIVTCLVKTSPFENDASTR